MVGHQLHPTDRARVVKEPRLRRLICAFCKHVAREPLTSPTCDHRFCSSCLEDICKLQNLQNGPAAICPEDGKQLCQFSPDELAHREVAGLVVHCTFMDDGCTWKGELQHLEMHVEKYHLQFQSEQRASSNKTPILHKGAFFLGAPPCRDHAIFGLAAPGPSGVCADHRLDGSAVETPHGAEQAQHLGDEQAQFVQQTAILGNSSLTSGQLPGPSSLDDQISHLVGHGPSGVHVNRRLYDPVVGTPHGAEQSRPVKKEQQAQLLQQQDEIDLMKRELANLRKAFDQLQNRMQRWREDVPDETEQMKAEIAKFRGDLEQLQNRVQVVEEHHAAPPRHVREECSKLQRQLNNERQDRERQQEEWQARLQAMEQTLAVFYSALENEKRDRTQELAAQINSCEAFHGDCVAEREHASNDRDMEVGLLQNSYADLEARVSRLERN